MTRPDPERRRRVEAIFDSALERPEAERRAYIQSACTGDPELQAEVEALLDAHHRAEGVLERLPMGMGGVALDLGASRPGDSDPGAEHPAQGDVPPPSPDRAADHANPGQRRAILLAGAVYVLIVLGVASAVLLSTEPAARPAWAVPLAVTLAVLGLPVTVGLVWALWPAASRGAGDAGAGARRGADPPSPNPLDTPPVGEGARVGPYAVLDRVGGGGMGVIHRAKDTRLERYVALKFLPMELGTDPSARDRFLVEAQAAAALDHPNLCTIHEIGSTEDGRLFIAMAYYEGETVKDRIARGPLPVAEAVDIARQVARGLGRAHERGVIHRDVKPANVLVTTDGIAKVLDFGVAKLAGVDLTQSGAAIGTVAYMSPEQIRGQEVTGRTDIWSLGVMLYEMLVGHRPFEAEGSIAISHRILESEPSPLSTWRRDAPAELERIVRDCLVKDPADRCPTMPELIRRLDALDPPESRGGAAVGTDLPAGQASVSPEGERRPACVLSAVLRGYRELVERLPPSDLDRFMARLRQETARIVELNGGTLNGWTHERAVCLFGVPVAQDDHLSRALWAARALRRAVLEIVEELGIGSPDVQPAMGVGVASSVIAVHPLNAPERRYRIAGPAVDAATRLANHAGPDEVLITDDCARRAATVFQVEAPEPLPTPEGEPRIQACRVLDGPARDARIDTVETRDLTPYAGREPELEMLGEAFQDAVDGSGRFVSVVGDPGVGKSRLVLEFRRSLDRERFALMRGRCHSFGTGTAYLPFIEALRDRLALEPTGEPNDAAAVAAAVRSISPDLEGSLEDEAHPMPAELEGDALRLAIVDALSALFTLGARERPGVLVLEDWHWADRASTEVLRQLGEMVSAYPLLVVVTARPDPEPDWGAPARHLQIHLDPLGLSTSAEIARAVLGADRLPDPLVRALHERTGGNPFFLEEVCRALQESGIARVESGVARLPRSLDDLDLPGTVQGVIRTRLDRLDTESRDVLRFASVIGREFSRPVLVRTLGDRSAPDRALDALRGLGLIQQIRVVPEPAYRFKHALTQEVTYEGLLHHQRLLLHRRVGEAIEELCADRLDEFLDRLARHFSRACVWPKAVRYGLGAAGKALALSRFDEAMGMLDDVLAWSTRLDDADDRRETRIEILFRQERLCETLGRRDRQSEIIEELAGLLDSSRDAARLAELHLRKGDLHTLTRDFEAAEVELQESLRLARGLEERVAERNALRSLGLLRWHQDRTDEAIELAEAALAIDRERGDPDGVALGLSNLANLLKGAGDLDRALECLFEALDLLGGDGDGRAPSAVSRQPAYILHNIAKIYQALGENEKALHFLQWAGSYDAGYLHPIHKSYNLTAIARIRLQQGKIEESLDLYREAAELCRRCGALDALSQPLRILGEVTLSLGRPGAALPHLTEAAELFEALRDVESEIATRRAVAVASEQLIRSGPDVDAGERRETAIAAWERVRKLAADRRDAARELEALEGMARLTRTTDPVRARRQHEAALERARELGEPDREAAVLNSLGIHYWTQGAYRAALGCYETALEIYERLDDRVHAGLILNSVAATLQRLDRLDEAIERVEGALELHRETGERLLEAHALGLLGEIRLASGAPEAAADHFEASLALRRELGDRRGEGWMLHGLAQARAKLGAEAEARTHAADAAWIAEELADDELAEACEGLASLAAAGKIEGEGSTETDGDP